MAVAIILIILGENSLNFYASFSNTWHLRHDPPFYINASFDYEAWLGLGNKTRTIGFSCSDLVSA